MSTSETSSADKVQSNVASFTKEINSLNVEITQIPNKMAQAQAQGATAVAKLQQEMKASEAKLCKALTGLEATVSGAEKSSQEAKDTVAKIQAQVVEMASDPSKIQEVPRMGAYITKFQQAITILDTADTSTKTYLNPSMLEDCKTASEGKTTKLFLAMQPVEERSFHVPSIVLGSVVGAAVVGALALYRAKGKTEVALMEEGIVE